MKKQLWFETNMFSPIPGEEEETNPGRYGKALANWVRSKLAERGKTVPEEPIAEDWGWVVMVQRKPYRLWIGCGNEDRSAQRWSVFVEAEVGFLNKLLGRGNASQSVSALEHELEAIVRSERELSNVAWEAL